MASHDSESPSGEKTLKNWDSVNLVMFGVPAAGGQGSPVPAGWATIPTCCRYGEELEQVPPRIRERPRIKGFPRDSLVSMSGKRKIYDGSVHGCSIVPSRTADSDCGRSRFG